MKEMDSLDLKALLNKSQEKLKNFFKIGKIFQF